MPEFQAPDTAPGPSRRAVRYKLVAIGLCSALLIGLLFSYVDLVATGGAGPKQSDYVAYYTGAHLVLTGRGAALYNFGEVGRYEAGLVHPLKVRNGVLPFVYPPYFAVALAPLAALPYALSYWLWLMLNLGALLGALFWLHGRLRLDRQSRVLLWVAALSFLPAFVSLVQGQTSILLLALCVLALAALERGRPELAAACLAFLLVKPPYVVPFLLLLAVQRDWRALRAFLLAAVPLIALPELIVGRGATLDYLHLLGRTSTWHTAFGYGARWNNSLAGFFALLLPSHLATACTVAAVCLSLAALAWVARRGAPLSLCWATAAAVALLISPHVLVHDLTLLLLPACLTLRSPDRSGLAVVLAAGYALLLAGLRLVDLIPLQLSVLAVGLLALWLVRSAVRTTAPYESHGSESYSFAEPFVHV